jgi:hypothetical protein
MDNGLHLRIKEVIVREPAPADVPGEIADDIALFGEGLG